MRSKKAVSTTVPVPPQRESPPLLPDKDADWGGFVPVPVPDEERPRFEAWFAEVEPELAGYVSGLLLQGLKLSLAYDSENVCFIATFTGRGHPTSALRMSLSARAADERTATALLVYKHYVLAGQDWLQFTVKGDKRQWSFG